MAPFDVENMPDRELTKSINKTIRTNITVYSGTTPSHVWSIVGVSKTNGTMKKQQDRMQICNHG